ncbi:MAG: hypothetical protein ACOYY2_03770 [Actinomycetota bacterium]
MDDGIARDMALHVDHWLRRNRPQSLRWITKARGGDVTGDDLDLVAEILDNALHRGVRDETRRQGTAW